MTDNFYHTCPPMMSDGRLFTDYRSNTRIEEAIKNSQGIQRDDHYRLYLQKNAQSLMDQNWNNEKKKSCWNNVCVHKYPTRMYHPWFVKQKNDVNSVNSGTIPRDSNCPVYKDYRPTH